MQSTRAIPVPRRARLPGKKGYFPLHEAARSYLLGRSERTIDE
jgi:hypothetical protein